MPCDRHSCHRSGEREPPGWRCANRSRGSKLGEILVWRRRGQRGSFSHRDIHTQRTPCGGDILRHVRRRSAGKAAASERGGRALRRESHGAPSVAGLLVLLERFAAERAAGADWEGDLRGRRLGEELRGERVSGGAACEEEQCARLSATRREELRGEADVEARRGGEDHLGRGQSGNRGQVVSSVDVTKGDRVLTAYVKVVYHVFAHPFDLRLCKFNSIVSCPVKKDNGDIVHSSILTPAVLEQAQEL
mmetsp:Transcript_18618/g.44604  ORF Transcript_18618/g.44604 Transcript_18618/m.44604 type:complete len:248 (-) Transcript_18618:89-832(-)